MSKNKVTGGCLCGAVRYEVDGEATDAWYCHCESCRRATGAPVTAWTIVPAQALSWPAGPQARHESSTGGYRGYCRDCGTSLSYETVYQGETVICVLTATLEDPDASPPTRHVFHDERIAWLETGDQLPR